MLAAKRTGWAVLACLVCVAGVGCGSASSRRTPVPRPADVTAVSTSTPPREETRATSEASPRPAEQVDRPPTPDPTSDAGGSPPVACVAPASALDPRTIVGHVSSRHADEATEGRFEGDVLGVDVVPVRDTLVEWRILVRRLGGSTGTVSVYAPRALPPPLARGQRARASVRGVGGGPNGRYDLVFHAPDGSLLLAVNQAPDGWQVERGRRAGARAANGYTERTYGVRFEHGDRRIDVAAGTWSRSDVDGCAYYLWGSAAQRELRRGRPAMPDYVGGWLDFAIVRAR